MGNVSKRNIDKCNILRLFFSLLFVVFVLTCCQSPKYSVNNEDVVCVVLEEEQDDQFLILKNDTVPLKEPQKDPSVAHIRRGNHISFLLAAKDNYYPDTCTYRRHRFSQVGENLFVVQLFRVRYSLKFSIAFKYYEPGTAPEVEEIERNAITYDPNGGTLLRRRHTFSYSTEHHPRPNTSIGTNIMKRDGYNLIGWNTSADGSGEHIGLGSRYLDVNNSRFTLYAEWAKYSEVNNFEFTVNENNQITINKYVGNEQAISIPEYISDREVINIAKDAFTNSIAETIIFPKSIKEIANGAFNNCAFKEIYLYDNIVSVHDDSFINCPNFSTVHINAIEGPRFVDADKHSPYADKVDRLVLNKDKQKIIILGGSGAYYNVDACMLNDFYPSHEVFNLAINGWFNGAMQMEIISQFMGEGDYLLHCVEMCGRYQFMSDISMGDFDEVSEYDYRYFCCLESNFDLISLADIRHVTHFFDVFTSFNTAREKLPAVSYDAFIDLADERGDYVPSNERIKVIPEDGGRIITHEGEINPGAISEEGATRLTNYYLELQNKGANVLFAYCPVNRDSLSEKDLSYENMMDFTSRIDNWLSPYCRVVNSLENVLLDFECFADSDWHLDYEHALIFTEQLGFAIGAL